jgi:hypothetical protein
MNGLVQPECLSVPLQVAKVLSAVLLEGAAMSWQGRGAFIAWHDVEEGREAEYLHWHSHEHMQERLAIPGFLRGRRYSVLGSGPQFLVIYEVTDIDVLSSPAYRERLEQPSAWTRKVMPAVRNMNRSLCRVVASSGSGVGRYLQTTRFSPEPGREQEVIDALPLALSTLADEPFLTGAHVLAADQALSRTPTQERSLRGGQDDVADWVLLVEGFLHDVVATDRAGGLMAAGANPEVISNLYEVQHLL